MKAEAKPVKLPEVEPVKLPEPDPLDPALVLTFADLDCLGRSLAKNISTVDELLIAVNATTSISVAGVEVRLEPRLLTRLKTRCLDKAAWNGWLCQLVVKQLHDYAGW